MQSIFALEQCKEANYQLSLDRLADHFKPDLNSMEMQDKALLKENGKKALKYFEEIAGSSDLLTDDLGIKDVVEGELLDYHNRLHKDYDHLLKSLIKELEELKSLYVSVLALVVAWAEVSKTDKKKSHSNFFEAKRVKALASNSEIQKLNESAVGWNAQREKARIWFKEMVRPDSVYQEYIELGAADDELELALMKHLFRKIILGKGSIHDHFEESVMRWAEDRDIIKSLVDKTLKSYNQDEGTIKIQDISLDPEDDTRFINQMFEGTQNLDTAHKDLIAANTKNWEVDRLPLIDRIILEMAITELIGFPNIPVKVTINEYIELAKHYSTPKSRSFINGILDVIARELKVNGVIKKSGRGLLDNK